MRSAKVFGCLQWKDSHCLVEHLGIPVFIGLKPLTFLCFIFCNFPELCSSSETVARQGLLELVVI